MIDLNPTIDSLRLELQRIEQATESKLDDFYQQLKNVTEYANQFDSLWAGGWAQENYNHYQNPNNQHQHIQTNEEYFYALIEKKLKLNVLQIGQDVTKFIDNSKKLQKKVITELSIIKDEEKFTNEIELLNTIEKFKWGLETTAFVNYRRPNHLVYYDISALNRGIAIPPHIHVVSHVLSIASKSQSPKQFAELLARLLRQLEIKIQKKNSSINDCTDQILTNIFENFHSFGNQLKNRRANRSTINIVDEYDVQDLLHSILKLHFRDVREEEYTPSYAGSSARLDFLLKNENIIIEVKKTRTGLADKHIGEQLILDVAYYRNHPNCKALICFVYDPENKIKNPRGLEADLKKQSDNEMSVNVFIRP
jgi:hypothetical protein